MSPQSAETEAIRRITAHLKAVYDGRRTPGQVEAAMSAAEKHFEDSRIRDFVPVLVERRARSALDAAIMAEASDHGHVDRRSSDASHDPNVTALPVTPRAATRSPATGAVLRIARPPASGS
ncbi:three-helix bundle dimerization domain-containing protein [Streptomyces sp. NPDC101209]|uniref:three-helix bundle dimerization domain-containing protein n=1 Tax=Streptomyces sp. NPDC101209 TaxID=3366129 RepID=UPI003822AF09